MMKEIRVMAVSEQMVTAYRCDACGKAEHAVDGEHPLGYVGSFSWRGKGESVESSPFYACGRTHVGKSVEAVRALALLSESVVDAVQLPDVDVEVEAES
jgi:hypothetical protein